MTNREKNACRDERRDSRPPALRRMGDMVDKTVCRWHGEGVPEIWGVELMEYFGLDPLVQFWLPHRKAGMPSPSHHGGAIIENEADYERIKPFLFPEDAVTRYKDHFAQIKTAHDRGDFAVWYTVEGCFWFPRTLVSRGILQLL